MALVGKIFETLDINQVALLQLGLVVVLASLLSTLLQNPQLRTRHELASGVRHPAPAVARHSLQRETRHHLGRTSKDHRG